MLDAGPVVACGQGALPAAGCRKAMRIFLGCRLRAPNNMASQAVVLLPRRLSDLCRRLPLPLSSLEALGLSLGHRAPASPRWSSHRALAACVYLASAARTRTAQPRPASSPTATRAHIHNIHVAYYIIINVCCVLCSVLLCHTTLCACFVMQDIFLILIVGGGRG
jgi:hypothetical protein